LTRLQTTALWQLAEPRILRDEEFTSICSQHLTTLCFVEP